MSADASSYEPDPAAVFAAATSLWRACHQREADDSTMNLGAAYRGMDQCMREVMRIAGDFETWACQHVVFAMFDDVWPYFLADRFGDACLKIIPPDALARFTSNDCLRVAFPLRLPLRADGSLRLPVDVRATHPSPNPGFSEFRIQTVRDELASDQVIPFTEYDDPFDPTLGPPYFSLYGLDDDGLCEHIADCNTYAEARCLAQKLAPSLNLPVNPICFTPPPP